MDFETPQEIADFLAEVDAFIEREIKPLERQDANRRFRITEGAEEIQMRCFAGHMFGFMKQRAPKGVTEE